MPIVSDRRAALKGLGIAAGVAALRSQPALAAEQAASLVPLGSTALTELVRKVAAAPRRRDFKTVPMILNAPDQWDHEALSEILAYQPKTKQAWDCTDIKGPWLNLIRNALNAQVWSFRHPDFLAVTTVHGTAQVALYEQPMWDKYQLAKLAGGGFKTNTLMLPKAAGSADPSSYENAAGAFSPEDNDIPALQRRGVMFLSCHNAIWEQAGRLIATGANPDKLSHEALAAELTNHLIPGVVLTPGAVGTLPELQQAGFHYAYAA